MTKPNADLVKMRSDRGPTPTSSSARETQTGRPGTFRYTRRYISSLKEFSDHHQPLFRSRPVRNDQHAGRIDHRKLKRGQDSPLLEEPDARFEGSGALQDRRVALFDHRARLLHRRVLLFECLFPRNDHPNRLPDNLDRLRRDLSRLRNDLSPKQQAVIALWDGIPEFEHEGVDQLAHLSFYQGLEMVCNVISHRR